MCEGGARSLRTQIYIIQYSHPLKQEVREHSRSSILFGPLLITYFTSIVSPFPYTVQIHPISTSFQPCGHFHATPKTKWILFILCFDFEKIWVIFTLDGNFALWSHFFYQKIWLCCVLFFRAYCNYPNILGRTPRIPTLRSSHVARTCAQWQTMPRQWCASWQRSTTTSSTSTTSPI